MTYLGQKVLGNFRDRTPAKHKNSERFKTRPGMSEEHLKLIRNLPCCICGKHGAEAHHMKTGTGERGMGIRSTDRWALPMCHDDHMEVERVGSRKEETWFRERGVYAALLALDLWTNTGDLARMGRVLKAHLEMAGRT